MITRCRPLLGTFVEITVPIGAGDAIEAAFDAIRHVHHHMSFHEPSSDLGLLRAAMPGDVVAVDRETIAVLRMAIAFHQVTGGLLEVAVGRELVRSGFLPRKDIGRLSRFPGDTADIEIVDDRHVRCKRRLLIDLGGIAKGHAVDRAVKTLIAAGIDAGLVNAGGDLRMFGYRNWQIYLREAGGAIDHMVVLQNCAIASSANLHNRRRHSGRTVGPHYGRAREPVLTDQRITVVADSCLVADAMTKVAMVDPELADNVLAAHRGHVLRQPAMATAA